MSRKKKRSRGNPVKSSRPIGSPAKRIDQVISACERWLSEGNNTTGGEADQGIAERHRDLAEIRLVTGVEDFLDWLGEGRHCSPEGGLQRKDIAPVAAMIGLSVKGTHTKHDDAGHRVDLPALDRLFDDDVSAPPRQHPVMSMWEVPELTAWWQAMQAVGIFSRSGTRVLPDQGAELLRSTDELEVLDIQQEFLAVFVERFFAAEAEPFQRDDFFRSLAPPTIAAAAAELVAALSREEGEQQPQPSVQQHAGLFGLRARMLLRRLADVGLLRGQESAYSVPPGLRQAIVQGVLMTRDGHLAEADEDDAEE